MKKILLLFACIACFGGAEENLSGHALFLADADELARLENNGFSLAETALGAKSNLKTNAALFARPDYRSIAESLAKDLLHLTKSDKHLGVGMAYSHRLFDENWLRSPHAFYELIGIVNRVDRIPFAPEKCGEIRLIYRLAYRASGIYSRLPMTINAVFWATDENNRTADCPRVAAHWQNLRENLVKNKAYLKPENLKTLEINMQSVRWPSTVRPDFGGYAEYFLRVFKSQSGKFSLTGLENTPDVERLRNSTALKEELLEWLGNNLGAIDAGVMVLPEKFLTKKVTSVALNGPGRLANLPFRQIFLREKIPTMPKGGKYTDTADSLLRRLDDMTCSGCHQARAVAGFHFTGADRAETDSVNAIFNPASAHFFADQPRRLRYRNAVLGRSKPSVEREISLRSDHEPGTFGAFCDTQGAGCDAGFRCVQLNRDARIGNAGICQPVETMAGSACRNGAPVTNTNPHRDRIVPQKGLGCGDGYFCQNVSVGFPGGMCSNGCKNVRDGEVCGKIANLQGFNDCLAAEKPFAGCLSGNVRPGTLKACDAEHACRPDYICAKISGNKGGCIPPYFLFQLRVDGHNF